MTACATKDGYHGMAHGEMENATNIPPIPNDFSAPPMQSALETSDGCEPRYREVRFHGNYGILCGQYQEFTRTNITESQIRQIGWSAFGMCGWNADRCA